MNQQKKNCTKSEQNWEKHWEMIQYPSCPPYPPVIRGWRVNRGQWQSRIILIKSTVQLYPKWNWSHPLESWKKKVAAKVRAVPDPPRLPFQLQLWWPPPQPRPWPVRWLSLLLSCPRCLWVIYVGDPEHLPVVDPEYVTNLKKANFALIF